jgi:hypothetical protein
MHSRSTPSPHLPARPRLGAAARRAVGGGAGAFGFGREGGAADPPVGGSPYSSASTKLRTRTARAQPGRPARGCAGRGRGARRRRGRERAPVDAADGLFVPPRARLGLLGESAVGPPQNARGAGRGARGAGRACGAAPAGRRALSRRWQPGVVPQSHQEPRHNGAPRPIPDATRAQIAAAGAAGSATQQRIKSSYESCRARRHLPPQNKELKALRHAQPAPARRRPRVGRPAAAPGEGRRSALAAGRRGGGAAGRRGGGAAGRRACAPARAAREQAGGASAASAACTRARAAPRRVSGLRGAARAAPPRRRAGGRAGGTPELRLYESTG